MGFFTKLKKIWKTEDAPQGSVQSPREETSTPAEQAADLWVSAEAFDAAQSAAAPTAPEPEQTPQESEALQAPETEPAAVTADAPVIEPTVADEPALDAATADAPPLAAAAETVAATNDASHEEQMEQVPPAAIAPEDATGEAPLPPQDEADTSAEQTQPPTPAASETMPAEPAAKPVEPVQEAPAPVTAPTSAPVREQASAASATAPWRDDLVLALRQAEPRLSVWLDILLEGVEIAGPELWQRLRFLFESLEAPAAEAETFVAKFADWVTMMEYDEVELFRSELQYRLALALDLEDEEDERNRLFLKLSQGLSKTKEQIVKRIDGLLGRHSVIDEAFWEELEEILIMADVGFEPAAKLLDNLRSKVRKRNTTDPAVFKDILREELAEIFRTQKTIKAINPPEVVMMIGVNGVGKTTTIAKLAHRDIMRGKKVLIAAGDTFRAAAIEQLEIWAKRVGATFYAKGEGSDPAAVAFEAMDKGLAENFDIIYLDTAGRLHTKTNLMEELRKIRRVVSKKHAGAPHRSVLVLDATTGQNALSQTKLFNEAAGVDEIILTKLDGTAKGGVVVGIALSFGVPITYVGLGEKMEDLRPFDGQDFAQALLGVGD